MSPIEGLGRDLDEAAERRRAAQEELRESTDSLVRHMWFTSIVAGVTVGLLFGLVIWLLF